MTPTEITLAAFAAIFINFDPEAARSLLAPDYIQHNPAVPTGAEPIIQFIPGMKASGVEVTVHRVITDGDFVVMHNSFDNADAFGASSLVAFDVFRVENGKVAEHWDNVQPLAGPNASGRTMTDGPTEIVDFGKTLANKALVTEFSRTVLVGGDFDRITDYVVGGDAYRQHNPSFGDGIETLGAAFAESAANGAAIQYTKVHKILGEGNFVFMMSEGKMGEIPTAYFDLFRLEEGKIVEHWDTVSEIPAEMAHANGKF